MATTTVTTAGSVERQRRVDDAIHSGEMEGMNVAPATRADAGDYVAGRITSDELVDRARARYGLV